MATLTMRDGTRVQVPDNATPAQIQQIAQAYTSQKHESSAQAGRETAWDETPMLERVAVGFAKPFVETAKGVKSLFTDLGQDERNLLEAGKGVRGAAGTAGEIAGNVATFAIPGGVAARGGRAAASMLPRSLARGAQAVRTAMRTGPEIATAAGMEALKAPTDSRSRGDAALEAAVGGAVGAGAGRVLRRALRGVAQSPAGRALLGAGVPLTPGMAARGDAVPWLEQRMAALPLIGGPVTKMQERAIAKVNELLAEQGAKPMKMRSRNRLERTVGGLLAAGGTLYHPGTAAALGVGRYALPNEFMRKLLTGRYESKPVALARALSRYGGTSRTAGAAVAASADDDSE